MNCHVEGPTAVKFDLASTVSMCLHESRDHVYRRTVTNTAPR